MIKLIVSDIDGTLMDRSKIIRQQDIDAVQAACGRGIRLCLASGRLYEEIQAVREQLQEPCFSICQNGASVVSESGELLSEHTYNTELALAVLEMVDPSEFVTVVCTAEGNSVQREDDHAARICNRFLTPPSLERDMREAVRGGMRVTKFSVYGEVAQLERLLAELDAAFGASISASFSDPDGIDIMPGGVDKGAGVRLLMERLGLAQHEVACIGDSFNDLAMFDVSPNSFAMSHASIAVRNRAVRVVDSVSDAIGELLPEINAS